MHPQKHKFACIGIEINLLSESLPLPPSEINMAINSIFRPVKEPYFFLYIGYIVTIDSMMVEVSTTLNEIQAQN